METLIVTEIDKNSNNIYANLEDIAMDMTHTSQ